MVPFPLLHKIKCIRTKRIITDLCQRIKKINIRQPRATIIYQVCLSNTKIKVVKFGSHMMKACFEISEFYGNLLLPLLWSWQPPFFLGGGAEFFSLKNWRLVLSENLLLKISWVLFLFLFFLYELKRWYIDCNENLSLLIFTTWI